MKADIIYIQESQLNAELQLPSTMLDNGVDMLAIIVQLKPHLGSFQPLISNLIDIRKEKLKKRIVEWFQKNEYPVSNLKIEVIEELSEFQNIDFRFFSVRNLLVLAKSEEEKRITATLKKGFPKVE